MTRHEPAMAADSRGRRTLVAVFAHPDDETFSVGGTLAGLGGVHRVLVCATRGEAGQISDPSLATRETLGEVRERELREAARLLGVEEVIFLGYRDSGMAGTPENEHPRALVRADEREVIARLVGLLRRYRPDVVVTFDPTGGYGHPDHIAVHRFTAAAFDAAADPAAYPGAGPPYQPGRLYYSGIPRGVLRAMVEQAERAGMELGPLRQADIDQLGIRDEAIDVVTDVGDRLERKLAAMRAHRTQFGDVSMIERMPPEARQAFLGREYFQLARGPALPGPRPAADLFAGLPDSPGRAQTDA